MPSTTINPLVDPLLTDLYQLTMAYGYWKNRVHEKTAVFDLFFRRCPFGGEFAIYAGLEQVLCHLEHFRFRPDHIKYLQSLPEFANREPGFYEWLLGIDCSRVTVYALREGTVAFPRIPLLRIEGPLAIVQLLETTLLTLVNYPSLVATNAARYRLAAGWDKTLLEFGLRRAQGPDGGMSASYYSYLGGFDGSSNVKAGELFGIPVAGTHAHAFVESFTGLSDLKDRQLRDSMGTNRDFLACVLAWRQKFNSEHSNDGELAAFIAYALAFPDRFTALVDTYNTLQSGIPNFICVAAALFEFGYTARGIRLDSGDLAFLSLQAKQQFAQAAAITGFAFDRCRVTASNDINEAILHSLSLQAHGIDNFGIGTNLVTCEAQPAFGGVFKLVEIEGKARIKLSENVVKITIPGKKQAFRLYGQSGYGLVDLLIQADETSPKAGEPILCKNAFDASKKVNVIPAMVEDLLLCVWDGQRCMETPTPAAIRDYVVRQLRESVRPDHLRPDNPADYKVSVSEKLHSTMTALIEQESIIKTIS